MGWRLPGARIARASTLNPSPSKRRIYLNDFSRLALSHETELTKVDRRLISSKLLHQVSKRDASALFPGQEDTGQAKVRGQTNTQSVRGGADLV